MATFDQCGTLYQGQNFLEKSVFFFDDDEENDGNGDNTVPCG